MREQSTFLGRPVYSLQTMLRYIAVLDASLPSVVPDGIYGEDTMRAVTALQRQMGLPATGVTDLQTWEAITLRFLDASERQLPPAALEIILEPDQRITAGESNDHVYLVQAMLEALAAYYENIPPIAHTGVMDDATVAAILWLQNLSGLPATGELSRIEWRYLTGLYRLTTGAGKGYSVNSGQWRR